VLVEEIEGAGAFAKETVADPGAVDEGENRPKEGDFMGVG